MPERIKMLSLLTPQGWALSALNGLLLDPMTHLRCCAGNCPSCCIHGVIAYELCYYKDADEESIENKQSGIQGFRGEEIGLSERGTKSYDIKERMLRKLPEVVQSRTVPGEPGTENTYVSQYDSI